MKKNLYCFMIMLFALSFTKPVKATELTDSNETVTLTSGEYTIPATSVTIYRVEVVGDVVLSGTGTLNCRMNLRDGGSLTVQNGATLDVGNCMGCWGGCLTNNGTIKGIIAEMEPNTSVVNNSLIEGGVSTARGGEFINNGTVDGSSWPRMAVVDCYKGRFVNNGTIIGDFFTVGNIDNSEYEAINSEGASITIRECNGNDGILQNNGTFSCRIYGPGLRVVGNAPIGVEQDLHPVYPIEENDNEAGDKDDKEDKEDKDDKQPNAETPQTPSTVPSGTALVSIGSDNKDFASVKALTPYLHDAVNQKIIADLYAAKLKKRASVITQKNLIPPYGVKNEWKSTSHIIKWKDLNVKKGDTIIVIWYTTSFMKYGSTLQTIPATVLEDGTIEFTVPYMGDMSVMSIVKLK